METSCFTLLGLLVSLSFFLTLSAQMTGNFNCSGSTSTCQSLVGYSSKNATTLRNIQTLFAVKNLRSILGANNLPLNTSRDQRVNPNQVVRVPIHCSCSNGTGVSNRDIEYTIKKDDILSFVATEIFGGLVTYEKISEVNKIPDPNKIEIGQKFWIPLPCSCDKLNGEDVVHYAHVVKLGSSLGEIAAQFGTDNTTLAQLNGIIGDSQLLADKPLDVPLKACSSSVRKDSLDAPLLLSNNSYVFTANNCVKCTCDALKNWTLSCQSSSEIKPSNWQTCPPFSQCDGALLNASCRQPRDCVYAGYSNQTIFTTASPACPDSAGPDNYASTLSSSFNFVIVLIQCALLCLCLL
ncbi:LysM domain-containing GPI-anchored protein 2 [Arabidopsis thaliana]|jgi:LysM repeat protein|uniref:LysM domain-containing GPI-anchored protein 2 n=4 Tax=Arabidopsis TaxID=3701 RepID=LYM2_ARATH|nr:lysm domain GPI-anchored protein 2 precursor [Arabidopsis thaliana]O23006.1 RecName: Full=LysM domain-containing GPI-anchored protein 2; AltName: Full=Chitin elicitor-binding protein LYM2; Short=CEBiP LYM2; Flags: Precursor [Arabidopsis thaliana]KAG7636434.1 LysM domain [Arabidopsis thaliana x Arabidopsis arenosa]KAG7641058.1 LysM domain [Arabidopsis suecica]AAL07070.1 unknown protein [Arabidopsis thaliana]AAL16233.1 delta-8 sphingolipid desaturase [Arabidopsis thaliana]AAM78070.1 At2g1712|eukprot:NP_565406.1 lysm domain GPI-anchored protein 2 precursor [Arabidopsis thaliana]